MLAQPAAINHVVVCRLLWLRMLFSFLFFFSFLYYVLHDALVAEDNANVCFWDRCVVGLLCLTKALLLFFEIRAAVVRRRVAIEATNPGYFGEKNMSQVKLVDTFDPSRLRAISNFQREWRALFEVSSHLQHCTTSTGFFCPRLFPRWRANGCGCVWQ